ncbi:MAG: AAA family ATPase [Bacillota bacterium]
MNDVKDVPDGIAAIKSSMAQVIVGKSEVIDLLLTAFLSEGHVLIEDVPGVGKTLLAKTFAQCMGLVFRRIQFTPDLMPADVTGTSIFNQKTQDFEFRPGPVFTDIILAEEILADLGWKPGPDGVLVKDGQRFSFVHFGQTGFAQYEKVNTMLQAQLAKVGIEMEIRLLEPAAFTQRLREQVDPKDMDSHLTGAGPDPFDPDYTSRFHSKSYPAEFNVYGYSNPEADRLLEKGVTTTDRDARKEIYYELQNIIMEDIPYIPLYEFIDVNAVWDDLGGVPEDTTKDSSVITWYFTEKLYIKEPSGK